MPYNVEIPVDIWNSDVKPILAGVMRGQKKPKVWQTHKTMNTQALPRKIKYEKRLEMTRTLFNRKMAKLDPDDPASSRELADFYWNNYGSITNLLALHDKDTARDILQLRRIAQFENQLRLRDEAEAPKMDLIAPGEPVETYRNPEGEIVRVEKDETKKDA